MQSEAQFDGNLYSLPVSDPMLYVQSVLSQDDEAGHLNGHFLCRRGRTMQAS